MCLTLCNPMDCPWNSPGQNTEVGSLSILQGIFPTQRSNPGLLHCRQSLYQLSHKGSPRILEWFACPFSRESSWPRNPTGISCIAGGFFTSWATRGVWWEQKDVYLGFVRTAACEAQIQEALELSFIELWNGRGL